LTARNRHRGKAFLVEKLVNRCERQCFGLQDNHQLGLDPGRVGKQIRDRWVNHLNPAINHLPFSREDDLMLWEGHKKLGKRWVEISTKYFNNTRSENHTKNRWYSASFKKFISNEFGPEAYNGGKSSGTSSPTKKDSPNKKKPPLASSSRRPMDDPSQMEAV